MQISQFNLNAIENILYPQISPLTANGANYNQWYVLMATRLNRFGVLEDLESGNLGSDKEGIIREFQRQ